MSWKILIVLKQNSVGEGHELEEKDRKECDSESINLSSSPTNRSGRMKELNRSYLIQKMF